MSWSPMRYILYANSYWPHKSYCGPKRNFYKIQDDGGRHLGFIFGNNSVADEDVRVKFGAKYILTMEGDFSLK